MFWSLLFIAKIFLSFQGSQIQLFLFHLAGDINSLQNFNRHLSFPEQTTALNTALGGVSASHQEMYRPERHSRERSWQHKTCSGSRGSEEKYEGQQITWRKHVEVLSEVLAEWRYLRGNVKLFSRSAAAETPT